jgi:catechol 2,3-dioxygenase-like lactoylglutathione lyase family enzyme
MLLNHVGVINTRTEDALRFYRDFLGFDLTREVTVSPELSEQLFAIAQDIPMMVFEKDGIKIEVFIYPECKQPFPDIRHIGLSLENFSEIAEEATKVGIDLVIGKAKDKTVYFIKDFSGNLIEIKQL